MGKQPNADQAPREFERTAKAVKKGLIMVYTGEGKGKTSAALGGIFRALGRNWRVGVVQFIKGTWKTGEAAFAKDLGARLDFFEMGEGFTWDTKDFKKDVASARKAWEQCLKLLKDERYQLIIFDELNYVLKYNFLDVNEVIKALRSKHPATHVILTGRDAPAALIELADLVTEMRQVKHPYEQGIQAQAGIDY